MSRQTGPFDTMNFLSDSDDGGAEYTLRVCMCMLISFPAFQIDDYWAAADHSNVQTVYNDFEISDRDFWQGKAYTVF